MNTQELNPVNLLQETAEAIVAVLQHCGTDDCTDSSGYYGIREFPDGTDRAVDVYKSSRDGKLHYVVYCSYEDEDFDYRYTEDLSVEQLLAVLQELAQVDKE